MARKIVVRGDEPGRTEHSHGDTFGYRRESFGSVASGEKLGCSVYEVEPGKRAWPYHYHAANEEAIYVLQGAGTLRVANEEVEVSAGDYASFPSGTGHAHQLVNTSDSVLRYLCFSTMTDGGDRLPGLGQVRRVRGRGARRPEGEAGL